jgi:alpha-glucosidase (family GH31 glycosyl hydrolase)
MGKLVLTIALIVATYQLALSKTLGNFSSYKQITDKEVLFTTTNGSRILITANQEQIIGIQALGEQEIVNLTLPCDIDKSKLTGSLYVEELDNQIEISSSSTNGIRIRINKQPFKLSYFDPKSKEVYLDEFKAIDFSKNGAQLTFSKSETETLELRDTEHTTKSIDNNELNAKNYDPILIMSSKGYCILIDSPYEKLVQLSKKNKLNVNVQNKREIIQYYIVTGINENDIMQQVALFNSKFEGTHYTLK